MNAIRTETMLPAGRMRAIAMLAACALFMEAMDGTIVAIALPEMARYFRVDVVDMNVGMTSYLVALAVLLPLSTWVAERWGTRRVFTTAVALFTLASIGCAASPSLPMFVAARLLQGGAGAMMTPVARLAVLRNTSKSGILNAVALLTWPALFAPAIAPPLGGLIVEHLNWQWIFLINVPFGLAGVVAGLRFLPKAEPIVHRGGMDWPGLAIWSVAAVLTVGGIESAARLSAPTLLAVLGGGLCATVGGWFHFWRRKRPLLDVRLIGRHPSFAMAIVEGTAFRSTILANPFLLPLYFQIGLGKTITETGVLIMIGMAGNIGMKTLTSPILRRLGFQPVLWCNGLLLGASFAAFALTGRDTPDVVIVGLLFLSGLFRSMQFTALNTLAFADVTPSEMPQANTLLSTATQINGAMGVAVGALALQIGARLFGAGSVPAFHLAFWVLGGIAGAAALACLRFDRHLGSRLVADHGMEVAYD